MAYPAKTERNKDLVKMKDEKGMSFGQIAEYFNFKSRMTAFEIYHREKNRQQSEVNE